MNLILGILAVLIVGNTFADDAKETLCASLAQKNAIFKSKGSEIRGYAMDLVQHLDFRSGARIFDSLDFFVQCKNKERGLIDSIKYSAYQNVLAIRSTEEMEEIVEFYRNDFPKLLKHVSNYYELTAQESDELLSFKDDLPLFTNALEMIAAELGTQGRNVEIKNEIGSIKQRKSENKIIIDCHKLDGENCREIWFVEETANKRTVINRAFMDKQEIHDQLKSYDKEYFKFTKKAALLIYGSFTSELIVYSPLTVPVGVVGTVIAAPLEGTRYVLSKKNHKVAVGSVNGTDEEVSKNRFSNMVKLIKDTQFIPYKKN